MTEERIIQLRVDGKSVNKHVEILRTIKFEVIVCSDGKLYARRTRFRFWQEITVEMLKRI